MPRAKLCLFNMIMEFCKYDFRFAPCGSDWCSGQLLGILGIFQFGCLLVLIREFSSSYAMPLASLGSSVGKIGVSRISRVLVLTRSGIGVEIRKFPVALPVGSYFCWCILGKIGYFGSAHCPCLLM